MAERYEESAFGGVDIWLVMGLSVLLIPLLVLGVGIGTGAIPMG